MPWGVAAAVGGSVVSGLMSDSGGGGGGGPNYYTPQGLSQSDQYWQDLLKSQMNLYNAGNPYASGYQNASDYAGHRYWNLGEQAVNAAGIQYSQAAKDREAQYFLQGAGQNIWDLARDPQNALYNRTQQQLTDQVNAGQALRGLGTSAIGGQEYNQAMSNFNIDWQNNLLNRATQGASALSGLYGQAGNYGQLSTADLNAGLGFYGAGAQAFQNAGAVPYNAANTIMQNQLGQAQSIQGQIIPYMNYGQGAQQAAYTNNAQAAGATGALVNQGISALGNYFGGTGSSGGGYGYSGAGSLFGGSTANYSATPTYGFG